MKIPKFHQLFLSVVDVCKFIYQLKLTNEILTRNLEKKLLSRFCWLSSEKNKDTIICYKYKYENIQRNNFQTICRKKVRFICSKWSGFRMTHESNFTTA